MLTVIGSCRADRALELLSFVTQKLLLVGRLKLVRLVRSLSRIDTNAVVTKRCAMGLLNTKLMANRDYSRRMFGSNSAQFAYAQKQVELSQETCVHDLTKDFHVKEHGFWVDPGDTLTYCKLCSAAVAVNGVPFGLVPRKRDTIPAKVSNG